MPSPLRLHKQRSLTLATKTPTTFHVLMPLDRLRRKTHHSALFKQHSINNVRPKYDCDEENVPIVGPGAHFAAAIPVLTVSATPHAERYSATVQRISSNTWTVQGNHRRIYIEENTHQRRAAFDILLLSKGMIFVQDISKTLGDTSFVLCELVLHHIHDSISRKHAV